MDSLIITIKSNDGEEFYNKQIAIGSGAGKMMEAISPDFFAEIMDVIASAHIAKSKNQPYAKVKDELSKRADAFVGKPRNGRG